MTEAPPLIDPLQDAIGFLDGIRAQMRKTTTRRMAALGFTKQELRDFDARIQQLYANGVSGTDIARVMGVGSDAVYGSLRAQGIERRSPSGDMTVEKRAKILSVCRDFAPHREGRQAAPKGVAQKVASHHGLHVNTLYRYWNHPVNPYGPNYEPGAAQDQ